MLTRFLDDISNARSKREVVSAMSQYLEDDLSRAPLPLPEVGPLHLETLEDIDTCIGKLEAAVRSYPLIGPEEDRVQGLLCYLQVAAIRAGQIN